MKVRRYTKRHHGKKILITVLLIGTVSAGAYYAMHTSPLLKKEMQNITNAVAPQTLSTQKKNAVENKDDWRLVLVNKYHPLQDSFSVDLAGLSGGHSVDKRILPDLQEMMDAMRTEGLSPLICSAYRTKEKQTQLYQKKVKEYINQGLPQEQAAQKAATWVAAPNTSEHQLGLALDIVSKENQNLDHSQEQTDVQQWLMKHCYEYGFILRYPPAKRSITGVEYEPWHYRYVGKEHAKKIRDLDICLEEYLN